MTNLPSGSKGIKSIHTKVAHNTSLKNGFRSMEKKVDGGNFLSNEGLGLDTPNLSEED